eukprot:scaffold50920_cov55-Phaeocystis_antarctica.AAC.1
MLMSRPMGILGQGFAPYRSEQAPAPVSSPRQVWVTDGQHAFLALCALGGFAVAEHAALTPHLRSGGARMQRAG